MTRTKIKQLEFEEKIKPFYKIESGKYFCKKCDFYIISKLQMHHEKCKGFGVRRNLSNPSINYKYSLLCDMGCGNKSSFFYKTGKAYCCKLGAKCPVKTEKDKNKKIGKNPFKSIESQRAQKGKVPWNKGLKKETNNILANAAKKSSQTNIKRNKTYKFNHTENTKKVIKQAIINRYANGWQSTSCGRAKSYPYDSPIAGVITLTGTWEVAFAQALDKTGINWSKNKKRFDYIKPDGIEATYLPDFYIDEWQTYVEIKGYETDLDKAKWSYFTDPIIVIRKKEVFQLKKWLKENIEITETNLKNLITIDQ